MLPSVQENSMLFGQKKDNYEQSVRKWKQIRSRGRTRFILVRGMLGWGGLTAAFWFAFMMANGNMPIKTIMIGVVFFPLAGLLWGWWVWKISERQFNPDSSKNDPTSSKKSLSK